MTVNRSLSHQAKNSSTSIKSSSKNHNGSYHQIKTETRELDIYISELGIDGFFPNAMRLTTSTVSAVARCKESRKFHRRTCKHRRMDHLTGCETFAVFLVRLLPNPTNKLRDCTVLSCHCKRFLCEVSIDDFGDVVRGTA